MKFPVLLLCGLLYAAASALPSGIDLASKALAKRKVHFPYVAIVGDQNSGIPLMNGVIISPSWVLTFIDKNLDRNVSKVVAGASSYHKQIVNVTEVILNPDTSTPLALIKVATPFKFDESVQPIALPHPDNEAVGKAVVAGWTEEVFDNVVVPVLDSAKVKAISNKECDPLLSDIFSLKFKLLEGLGCAIVAKHAHRFREWGGPVVQNGTLLGITDFHAGNHKHRVAIFTKITPALDFIKKHVTDL